MHSMSSHLLWVLLTLYVPDHAHGRSLLGLQTKLLAQVRAAIFGQRMLFAQVASRDASAPISMAMDISRCNGVRGQEKIHEAHHAMLVSLPEHAVHVSDFQQASCDCKAACISGACVMTWIGT